MRVTKKNNQKSRKEKVYESKSFKEGKFTEEELKQYGLLDEEVTTILEYQALLPILQDDNCSSVDARTLHHQLKVGRDFSTWIKQQIDENSLIEGVDYDFSKGNSRNIKVSDKYMDGKKPLYEYSLTLDAAKSIAMLAGAKSGNTNIELKEMSKLVRRYFITIEKAFKNRRNWNHNRKNTLINCKELRGALIAKKRRIT